MYYDNWPKFLLIWKICKTIFIIYQSYDGVQLCDVDIFTVIA